MEREFFNDIIVVKRSGQRVNFNATKVAIAVKKGFDSVYEDYDEKKVNTVYERVLKDIEKNYESRKTIGVEEVQDIIEKELKKYDETVYESFAGYRE
jgi:transcriptional regulator NrdR family protein